MKKILYIASKSWKMIDGRSKFLFYLSILLFVLTTVLRISGPILFSLIIESVNSQSTEHVLLFCVVYASIFCASRFLEEFRLACYIYFEQILQKNLILNTLGKFFILSFESVRKHSSSETSIIIDRGLGGIRTALYNAIFTLFPLLAECLLLLLVVGLKIDIFLAFELLVLILLFLIVTFHLSSKTQMLQQKWFSTASKNYQIMSEGIRSFESLRSFKETQWLKDRYENATDKFISEVKHSLKPGIILGIIQGAVLFILFLLSTLTVLDMTESTGKKVALLVMINGLLLQIAVPLLQFSSSYKLFIQGISSASQLFDLIQLPESAEKIPHIHTSDANKHILLKNIEITYFNAQSIKYKDITIQTGKITVFAGPSGIGKSSLAKCIAGIVEYKGTIESEFLIDSVYYLHQHVDIFDLSFRDNIILGREYVNDKFTRIIRACGFSDDEIATLSSRNLGEGGKNISGGQAQRIGIARMLYHDAKVMILDEPTSGLDDIIVHNVIETIKKAAAGLTCIIVTHDKRVKDIGDVVIDIERYVVMELNNF
ncbi:TPA: ABC transporter ATP-binding protein [Klebsiella pneumoniae]|uniref:Transport ATP-binding protein CydC n=2 Tax=Klebsiella pneumoniae TaxID=573 RepID=A0A377Z6M3_KLEPO|nr:ABC transporter ATP-binding protein [Klebsiella pneumoniae]MBU9717973.1 ABC transporter ATP-binding protein/permease [Klebsiella pneumoniae subsp. ozaenae]VFS28105.1 Lactococcin-G-processing and transport ATP-binding protein LagD [Serratia liquefaciens]AYJ92255.1 ABC transporter ATP-binding protein [Klebsiella pneumoniae]RLO16949.1 ABC transporter ATP-binding protein [Klebsiella pneumoniae]SQC20559.1 transport ATP-binding protein CydC [Klebsiella pneumoniae]